MKCIQYSDSWYFSGTITTQRERFVLYAKRASSSNQDGEIIMLTLQSRDQKPQMPHDEPRDNPLASSSQSYRAIWGG